MYLKNYVQWNEENSGKMGGRNSGRRMRERGPKAERNSWICDNDH